MEVDSFMINSVCENLVQEYDCSNIEIIDEQLEKKTTILKSISRLAYKGKNLCGEIIKGSSGRKEKFQEMGKYGEGITEIDKDIEIMGLSNPEVKSLTDMFNKRKENVEDNNICSMAIETRKCYIDLISECEKLKEILENCLGKLSNLQSCYNSHNSINVAVPGR